MSLSKKSEQKIKNPPKNIFKKNYLKRAFAAGVLSV
jgi:hypothetical protein